MNNAPICEDAPCCGCCGPEPLEPELMTEAALDIETRGWPGEDDLADFNANEADDYRNEGAEDDHLEAAYEDANGCGLEDE